ncbi:hypothetical protein MUK72_16125 (plasmid) [Halococcus dombrowskii]|uniref:Carrier domain-containing protein n=1 Tax=Halococcus dombrowskii TaxID=179637 RepID=A0AAX3AR71_HALDO|nr:hypothetical protein [Halococcus dombrowskii]UOO96705.1 hypothetical protein MUK72_16125 [Halococcus dombrowskii]
MWEAVLDDAEVRPVGSELRLDIFDFRLRGRDQLDISVADVVDVLGERLELCEPFEVSSDKEAHLVEE